jgi:hypothetical protein
MPSAHVSSAPYNEYDPPSMAGEEELSPGTSSSTSESRPDRSGSSGTPGHPSPALGAESPSDRGQQVSPVQSSSVSSTDGSTPETGPTQLLQQDSSEGSAPATPATPAPVRDAAELMDLAHQAYSRGEYDLAEELLDEAEKVDASVREATAGPRAAIASARAERGASSGGHTLALS